MARRVVNAQRGEYLPQLAEGIRARIAYLQSAMPDVCAGRLACLNAGKPVELPATDVWSALFTVDPAAAGAFNHAHGGPWQWERDVWFEYDPRTSALVPVGSDPR
jgi:hypothetical protein